MRSSSCRSKSPFGALRGRPLWGVTCRDELTDGVLLTLLAELVG